MINKSVICSDLMLFQSSTFNSSNYRYSNHLQLYLFQIHQNNFFAYVNGSLHMGYSVSRQKLYFYFVGLEQTPLQPEPQHTIQTILHDFQNVSFFFKFLNLDTFVTFLNIKPRQYDSILLIVHNLLLKQNVNVGHKFYTCKMLYCIKCISWDFK